MKKVLIVVVLAVAAILLGGPIIGGQKAKAHLDSILAAIDANPGYDAHWKTYDKSWLATEAVLEISVDASLLPKESSLEAVSLPIDITIAHGPIIYSSGSVGWFEAKVALQAKQNEWVNNIVTVQGDGSFYQLDAFMNLVGEISYSDQTLPFSFSDKDATIEVAGWKGEGGFSSGVLSYAGGLPSVSILEKSGDNFVKLASLNVVLNADFGKQYSPNLMPSVATFSLGSVESNIEGETFVLKGVEMSAASVFSEDNKTLDISMGMSVEQLNVREYNFTNSEFSFAYERIGLEFAKYYLDTMTNMVNQDPDNMSAVLAEQLPNKVIEYALPYEPGVAIRSLKLSTDKGDLVSVASVKTTKLAEQPSADDIMNPLFWRNNINASFDLTIGKALATELSTAVSKYKVKQQLTMSDREMSEEEIAQTAEMQASMIIGMGVGGGFIVEDGDEYKSSFTFVDGVANLNGQPIPLPF